MRGFTARCALGMFLSFTGTAYSQTTLAGSVSGIFSNPMGGEVDGVGTNTLTFHALSGDGVLQFTPTSSYSAVDQPFLLGRIDFQSVNTSVTGLTFQIDLGTQNTDGSSGSVNFCLPVSVTQIDEPGFRQTNLFFDPDLTRTSDVNGTPYTFAFAGVTETDAFVDPIGTTLSTQTNGENVSAYIWATVTQAPPGTPLDPNCGNGVVCAYDSLPPSVPEPMTCVLGGLSVGGLVFLRRFGRK